MHRLRPDPVGHSDHHHDACIPLKIAGKWHVCLLLLQQTLRVSWVQKSPNDRAWRPIELEWWMGSNININATSDCSRITTMLRKIDDKVINTNSWHTPMMEDYWFCHIITSWSDLKCFLPGLLLSFYCGGVHTPLGRQGVSTWWHHTWQETEPHPPACSNKWICGRMCC